MSDPIYSAQLPEGVLSLYDFNNTYELCYRKYCSDKYNLLKKFSDFNKAKLEYFKTNVSITNKSLNRVK